MAMWQPTRYAKINLKTLIEIAHVALQILFISMSIVKTVIMVNFKTLKPFHSSWVFFCTFVSRLGGLQKFLFEQEWCKKKE